MPAADETLTAIESIVERSGDADEVLRDVVAALRDEAGYAWAGIYFVEGGTLALGPQAGTPNEASRTTTPVHWQGELVAELAVDDAPEKDRNFLERVASLVADHCLVGWDTGGESWEP
jgi:putative methionine-R-sulfoxide reductase with GAF domain